MSNARPTSRLARAQADANAGAAPPQTRPSALRAAISGARPFEPYTIPRLGLAVAVTLCPHNDQERIEGEVFERMRELDLGLTTSTENTYEAARAVRHMAITFVDPVTHEPIGSVEDWGAVDEDIIGECWRFQAAVRSKYDPIERPITNEQLEEIAAAVKKKDAMLLRFFGTGALASYLLATADQASNSPRPTFGASESSPES